MSRARLDVGLSGVNAETTEKVQPPGTFVSSKGCRDRRAAMDNEPKIKEPEIMLPAPKGEPERIVPEIPLDKDAPEKKTPIRGGN